MSKYDLPCYYILWSLCLKSPQNIITRLGRNCRIIFCGDFRQSDLQKEEDRNGLRKFMNVIKNMKGMSGVEFEQDDIVRSSFVKEYIISKLNYGIV